MGSEFAQIPTIPLSSTQNTWGRVKYCNLIQKKQNHRPHLNTMLGKEHLANKILINNVAVIIVLNQTLNMSIIICCYNETDSETQKGLN